MNTCKTCRWWGVGLKGSMTADAERYDGKVPHQPCGCPKIINAADMDWQEHRRFPLDCASFWDAESYSAEFATGPDFGCILWEAKESNRA